MGVSAALAPGPLSFWGWGPYSLRDHRGPRHIGALVSFALASPRPPAKISAEASFGLGPPRLPPHSCGTLLRFGTTEAPIHLAQGPLSCWDHPGPRCMGFGASFAWDHQGPRRIGASVSFALASPRLPAKTSAEASFALASPRLPPKSVRGHSPLCDHRGPLRMAASASFALGSPKLLPKSVWGHSPLWASLRPLPHGGVGLLCFGITDTPVQIGAGASFGLGPPRPPPHWCAGLRRFGTTEAPVALARGTPSLWGHRGTRCICTGASFVLASPRLPPVGAGASFGLGPQVIAAHWYRGLYRFGTTEAPVALARGPRSLWDHRGPCHVGAGAFCALRSSRPPRPPPHWWLSLEPQPSLRPSALAGSVSSTVMILACSNLGTLPVGKSPRESVSSSAHGHLRQACCAVG